MEQNSIELQEVQRASDDVCKYSMVMKFCVIQTPQHGTVFDITPLSKYHMDIVKKYHGVREPSSAGRVTFDNEHTLLDLFGESEGYGCSPLLPRDRFLAEQCFYDMDGISDKDYEDGLYLSLASYKIQAEEFIVGAALVDKFDRPLGKIVEFNMAGGFLIEGKTERKILQHKDLTTFFFKGACPKDRDTVLEELK